MLLHTFATENWDIICDMITVCYNVTSCKLVDRYQWFRGLCCLHLQYSLKMAAVDSSKWKHMFTNILGDCKNNNYCCENFKLSIIVVIIIIIIIIIVSSSCRSSPVVHAGYSVFEQELWDQPSWRRFFVVSVSCSRQKLD
jgi:hypothetical protein